MSLSTCWPPRHDHSARSILVRTEPDNISLPVYLTARLPTCAITCVQRFVGTYFQQTSSDFTSSLPYLCTQENRSGLTIGEGSLQCLVSDCTVDDATSAEVSQAYQVCGRVPGAIPNMASIITATIQPKTTVLSAAPTSSLPLSIGNPTISPQVTSIVMASMTPLFPPPQSSASAAPTLSTLSDDPIVMTSNLVPASSVSQTARTSSPSSDNTTASSGLTMPQILAIAITSGSIVLTVFALFLFLYWRRKNRHRRRRSNRWSVHVEKPPPLTPRRDEGTVAGPKPSNDAALTSHYPSQRFYASGPPVEDKRRSFWRKSIKPEEIGIAISPKMEDNGFSPASFRSAQSRDKLLPNPPKRALWPEPLTFHHSHCKKRQSTASETTIFDDDELEAQGATVPLSQIIPEQRPAPLLLDATHRPRTSAGLNAKVAHRNSARLLLTPTYDNGNFDNRDIRTYTSPNWSSWRVPRDALPVLAESTSPEIKNKSVATSGSRRLQKRQPPRLPLAVNKNVLPLQPSAALPAPPPPLLKEFMRTADTSFDGDSMPKDMDRHLQQPVVVDRAQDAPIEPRSPIKDLKYPSIPRSAAISPQAETPPRPRIVRLDALPPRLLGRQGPGRDSLVRAGASFMHTDTTSSDGYLSDQSIEWPAPPLTKYNNQAAFKTNMSRLRGNIDSPNHIVNQSLEYGPSLDQVLKSGKQGVVLAQRSPSTKVRLTPSKSTTGDLYLTVEI